MWKIFMSLALVSIIWQDIAGWRMFHRGRGQGGMLGLPNINTSFQLPPDEWFEQQLDHFDPTESATWKQRYFTNGSFYVPGGPVFLMIGGEGTASPLWMVDGHWIEVAKEMNALCFQLEHRYYGKSHPTVDTSVKNLVYLSSEQALADLAVFIEGMTSKYKLPTGTKWIAFGGSYPGSLAAWLRAKYPHLVHGAMSASGPLLAKADFKEYFGVVEDALATSSASCVQAVRDATKQVGILLRHRLGQKNLEKLFRLCDPLDTTEKNDVSNFYETLSGNIAGIVQYNKDNRKFDGAKATNITIDVLCSMMTDSSRGPAVNRYAEVSNVLLDAYNQSCLDYKYDKMVSAMQEVKWQSEAGEGGRQWTYQTCTEFGFYQTSELKPELVGDQFPLDFFVQQCSDIFGPKYNGHLLDRAIERTNTFYGAYDLQVSRVVFVHGSIDPWHALGITKALSEEAPAIYIEGTAHCANMYPSSSADPPQLKDARQEIKRLISEWLQQ